jgi:hypothetical protein
MLNRKIDDIAATGRKCTKHMLDYVTMRSFNLPSIRRRISWHDARNRIPTGCISALPTWGGDAVRCGRLGCGAVQFRQMGYSTSTEDEPTVVIC